MKRDKQIEELAEAIFLNCHAGLFEDEAKMIAKFCYQEIDRKASDVAKEIFEEIEAHFDIRIAFYQDMRFRAYSVGKDEEVKYANTMITNLTIYKEEIAELKKKYTEEVE